MKYLKMLGLAAIAAMALMAFVGAGTASATTLALGGVTQNSSVTLEATLESGTSATLKTTSGSFVDTCTQSTVKGSTEKPFTGTTVGGKVSILSFGNCTHGTTVVKNGTLSVEWAGGTNGTVRSTGAEVEVESTTFGAVLPCTTSSTHLGTLKGVSSTTEHATLLVNAVVNCGFLAPTANWEAAYTVTSPTGLGVHE